jgi:HprK-related kinase A
VRLGDLPPAELAVRLKRGEIYLSTGPFLIRLQTALPSLVEPIHFLYADFPFEDPGGVADFHLSVSTPGRLRPWWRAQAVFVVDGRIPFAPSPASWALPLLEWGLNWCVGFHAHRFLAIHSAVVERGGLAVILPGRPGSGKSTLCAALIHRGWRLLSDEFALVDPQSGALLPFPRPVSLKNRSIEVIREFAPEASIGPAVPDTHKGRIAYMRPPTDSVARATEGAAPAWVIFPAYRDGAAARLDPLPRTRALLRLAENSFNYSLRGVQGFERLSSVVESSRCSVLEYGDLEQAIKLFDSLEAPEDRPGEATRRRSLETRVADRLDAAVGGSRRSMPTRARPSPAGASPAAKAAPSPALLLRAFSHPETLATLAASEWDLLLVQARRADLLARLAARLEEQGVSDRIPSKVAAQLAAAQALAGHYERMARWEVNRIRRALRGVIPSIVLLKGSAYVLAELPAAKGRVFSDVDFMVPKETLPAVEAALLEHGWGPVKLDAYDQRYYRTWMHELPPLHHRDRHTVVDVHHSILPESGRLRPDARRLLAAARPIGVPGLEVLAPAHMVLHSAVHLFQDGDFRGGLQGLIDLDSLLRHFGARDGFWDELLLEAAELGLQRPLFYALRFAQRLLRTPVPAEAAGAAHTRKPPWPVSAIMDTLVTSALRPESPERADWRTPVALWLLYVRSHWLRMPPLLLAGHLLRKAFRGQAGSAP